MGLTIPDEHNPIAAILHQGKIAELPALENLDPTDAVNRAIAQVLGGGWLIAPIRINQQIWGAFSFQRFNHSSGWTDEERQLILSLTDQLAITIQQTNLYDSLQLANAELSRLATIDGLTQIANRRYFDQYLQQQWQLAQREQTNISLILCDVDCFKNFNDHYGHQAGDDCLIAIAKILTQAVRRPTDLAARYGGEEFALILPNTDLTGSLRVAERIQQLLYALEIPHMASSVSDRVTLSMGIVSLLPQVGQPRMNSSPLLISSSISPSGAGAIAIAMLRFLLSENSFVGLQQIVGLEGRNSICFGSWRTIRRNRWPKIFNLPRQP